MNKIIPFLRERTLADWGFFLILLASFLFVENRYFQVMDLYEQAILCLSTLTLLLLAWNWRVLQTVSIVVALFSLLAIFIYGTQIDLAKKNFLLKYFISSQSAILWMCLQLVLATLFYWIALFTRSQTGNKIASLLAWSGVVFGFIGLFVRWYESYLLGPDIGHIPISNLYEVFVLFCLITTLFYLYYQKRYNTYQLGSFVMLIVSAAVGFLLWYTVSREAYEIQPLVPALQSWWMKIHVPANFVGYGTFSVAAMVALAYLCKSHNILANYLPSLEELDDWMYKSIAIGFTFFTIATILGALWAAEAWGGYWSWDPKETWALIVWLNYAAWLHMRLIKGLRGQLAAWWALIGLLITTFAFLGVNMFLSGLHSYGTL